MCFNPGFCRNVSIGKPWSNLGFLANETCLLSEFFLFMLMLCLLSFEKRHLLFSCSGQSWAYAVRVSVCMLIECAPGVTESKKRIRLNHFELRFTEFLKKKTDFRKLFWRRLDQTWTKVNVKWRHWVLTVASPTYEPIKNNLRVGESMLIA